MHVAVPVGLLDDVALRVHRDLAGQIANGGDAVLHHDVHLVLAHSEVVVLLEIVHRAGNQGRLRIRTCRGCSQRS